MFPQIEFWNLDALTYAANPMSLQGVDTAANYTFIKADLRDSEETIRAFEQASPDWVFHFAAESHVDRSILGPKEFLETNVVGTFHLLECCRAWSDFSGKTFLHVSTDEVYGSLGETGKFTEETSYDPSSPYSASKASSDHFVRAYHRTYGLPTKITNCSNNYGPRQFPEKLIPLMILNTLDSKPLPVYGRGANVRDWLHVEDHCDALWLVASKGGAGDTYNIGGENERSNLDVVRQVCRIVGEMTGRQELETLITFVKDRPGHDLRYAIDSSKLRDELGWSPKFTFESGLEDTIRWYLDNPAWVESVRTGAYREWLGRQYGTSQVRP